MPPSSGERQYGGRVSASYPPGAPLRTGPSPRRGRVSPRVALRACLVALALTLLVVVATACGNAELPAAPPVATPPPTTTTAAPAPTTTAPPTTTTTAPDTGSTTASPIPSTGGSAERPGGTTTAPRAGGGGPADGRGNGGGTGGHGTPIWPATDASSARTLQKQVDGGREPWLLDPTEVATSYSGVVLNYRDPAVFPIRPGVVDVQDGASRAKATITLAQTVRQGDGGIWLVTEVRRR